MSDQPRKHSIGAAKTFVPLTQPDDISNLEFWFRSDQGLYSDAGVTAVTNGDSVQQWNDLSIHGRHLKANATRNPLYNSTTGANGYPGITFDGTTHTMIMDAITAIPDPMHYFAVFEQVAAGPGWQTNRYIWSDIATLDNSLFQSSASPRIKLYAPPGSTGAQSDLATVGDDHFIEALYAGASSTLVVDDNVATTGGVGENEQFTGLCLGGQAETAGFSHIIVTEVIGYSAEITTTDLANIRTYITDRYGIATN